MTTPRYHQEQADLLARARESARVIDQATAAQVARERAAGTRRIAPQRVAHPVAPLASTVRPDPFLQAITRRTQLGK